tara:strand:+ start:145 stop:390 length:246 start_codon:yes stop_codon:yes gene_type:complete
MSTYDNEKITSVIKNEINVYIKETNNWRQAIEKRLNSIEEAQVNLKTTSSKNSQEVAEVVNELRKDMEMMQDNVIVDISKD